MVCYLMDHREIKNATDDASLEIHCRPFSIIVEHASGSRRSCCLHLRTPYFISKDNSMVGRVGS